MSHSVMPGLCFLSDIKAEKQHEGIKQGIEHFPKEKLHHTHTDEKNPLPDKESMSDVLCVL